MADPRPDFEERTAEMRAAVTALRSEVDELHAHLQGATVRSRDDEAPEGAITDPEASDQEDVVPERLVSKSDAELAKTFDIASSLLGDAEERRDAEAIAYWRSLAAAALEESARRPEFGKAARGSRVSPKRVIERRRRRLIEQLREARESYAARER